jgi:feruloyl esterase
MLRSHNHALQRLGLSLLMFLFIGSASRAATCESLQALSLPNTTITLAHSVAAGAFSSPATGRGGVQSTVDFKQLPAFCRVAATLKPSPDSDIPLANWNDKFLGVGNGGLAGFITYTAGSGGIERGMAEALKRGYATASTDTGHLGDTAAPFLGHRETVTGTFTAKRKSA